MHQEPHGRAQGCPAVVLLVPWMLGLTIAPSPTLQCCAAGLHFSSANPRHAIVGGMDYEVLCGEWGGNKASRLGGGNRTGVEG